MIIDVPHIQQLGRDDCHVACMMMMLGWLKNAYEDSPDLSYDEVKKTMRWTRAGVRFCNAKLINNHKSILNSRIRPIFYCGPATTIEFLWEELERKKPVIAYLEQEHEDSMIKHSVIVNGINDNKTKIYCNDPFYEESITRNVGAFLEDWERMYRYVVHLSVEEDETLDAYVEEEKAQ